MLEWPEYENQNLDESGSISNEAEKMLLRENKMKSEEKKKQHHTTSELMNMLNK